MIAIPLACLLLVASHRVPQVTQPSADERYRFLAGLAEQGMHELAVHEAQEFLRAHPGHEKAPLARYRLAAALWDLGRHDEAAREYETLARAERFEYRSECLFRCGEAASARGDEDRARAAFEGVLASGQDYLVAPALLALAEVHFRARRLDEAERRYDELLRSKPASAEAPLARRARVWCAWERGDAAETVRRARASLSEERDPAREAELRLLLGEALLASDPEAAVEAFRALRTKEHAEARARGEGFALAALGDHAGAARAFEGLLARAPEGPYAREAALQAGVERLRAGEARAAVERLRAAARDGEAETLYWLAQAERQDGQVEAALATLERALRARPARELEARIHALRGDALVAAGRTDEALAAYERSGSSQALHAAAVAALNRGDAPHAARLAERLLRAAPAAELAQGARVVLAEALFAEKRLPEAERALAAALETPADAAEEARLRSRLAWCGYLAGDLGAARERFIALAEGSAGTSEGEEALALLVRISLEQGDASAARAAAERYLERHPRGRFADHAALTLARAPSEKNGRRSLADWLARFPSSELRPGVLLELGDVESAEGAHADAARRYAEVLELAPGSAEAARATYGLAWCAWEKRDLAACARALAPLCAPTGDPELRGPALELLVSVQLEQSEPEAAVGTWRELRGRGTDERRRLECARRILTALRSARRFEEAAALLDECARTLEARELVAEAQLEALYLALERGDPDAAEAALARARKAGAPAGSLAEAGYHLGESRLATGDEGRGLALLEGASAGAHPRAADALYRLGFVRLGRGELAGARTALAALLERHPESELAGEARFLLGECAFREQRFAEAAELFLAARARAEGELRAKVLFRAGLALGELGRWSECEAALAELAQAFPRFANLAEGELWRGRALAALRKERAARAAFERTLALDQGELAAAARLGLGALHEAAGRLDDALSEYLKVALLYAHEERVAEGLLAAGRVLEAQADPARAAARYRELAERHPESRFAERARERLRELGAAPGAEH